MGSVMSRLSRSRSLVAADPEGLDPYLNASPNSGVSTHSHLNSQEPVIRRYVPTQVLTYFLRGLREDLSPDALRLQVG